MHLAPGSTFAVLMSALGHFAKLLMLTRFPSRRAFYPHQLAVSRCIQRYLAALCGAPQCLVALTFG
jgi:hypothetical protein